MKQSEKSGRRNEIGGLGESIVCEWLESKGYLILDTNYLRKWGEIDVIAKDHTGIHFVEVKTVSYETRETLEYAVTHETWRPEEQVHKSKLKKLGRTIETWILEQQYAGEWQLDVAAVRMVSAEKYATINFLENIIAE